MQTIIQPTPVSTESIQDIVASLLQAGTNVTLTYNDVANTLTIAASSSTDTEAIQDLVSAMFPDSPTIDFSYNETNGVITANVITASITESHISLVDVASDNADTSKHGFLPKLSGNTTTFLRGDSTWVAPTAATDAEAVRDVVGAMFVDTFTINFSYSDILDQVTADLIGNSITYNYLQLINVPPKLLGRYAVGAGNIQEASIGSALELPTSGVLNVKDAGVTEAKLLLADNTTQNVTTARHGLVPKAPNVVTQYLDGTGAWSTPASSTGASQGAEVERNAVQSIVQNSNVAVSFDMEVRDDNAFWSSGQPTRFTIPTSGYYNITGFIQWDATTGVTRIVNIRINGTQYIATESTGNAGVDQRQNIAMVWYLSAGDYVEFILFQSTAGARNITARASIVGVTAAPLAATTFLALTDTPDVYVGNALRLLRVNAAANAVEFGDVLGTMATQNANAVAITGGTATFTGTVQARGIVGMTTAAFIADDVAGDAITGFRSNVNSAGGTGRYGIYNAGTAPNYFGGTVHVVDAIGVGRAPFSGVRLWVGYAKATNYGIIISPTDQDTGNSPVEFRNLAGSTIGSISTTSSATAYNTSSDVRLKHSVAPLTGALERVRALEPIAHLWNADNSPGEGFLAHELQQVIPLAVTGEPDAINEDGSIKPQQVDHSRLVPWLVGAVKELSEQIQVLQTRIIQLEGAAL